MPPGKHVVRARLVFSSGASVVMSDEGGFRWRVAGDVSFDVLSGIEVRVKVVPRREANQKDINKRFALSLPASPVMLARLDDGSLPEAPARKRGGTALEKGLPAVEEGTQREAKGASVGDGRPAKAERTRAADQGPLRVAQRDNPPEPRPETPRPAIPSAAPGGEPAEHAPAQRPPLPGPSAERPPDPPLAVRAPEPIAPGQPNSAAAKYEEEKTDGLWWMLGGLAVGLVGLVVLLVARRGGSRR